MDESHSIQIRQLEEKISRLQTQLNKQQSINREIRNRFEVVREAIEEIQDKLRMR